MAESFPENVPQKVWEGPLIVYNILATGVEAFEDL